MGLPLESAYHEAQLRCVQNVPSRIRPGGSVYVLRRLNYDQHLSRRDPYVARNNYVLDLYCLVVSNLILRTLIVFLGILPQLFVPDIKRPERMISMRCQNLQRLAIQKVLEIHTT